MNSIRKFFEAYHFYKDLVGRRILLLFFFGFWISLFEVFGIALLAPLLAIENAKESGDNLFSKGMAYVLNALGLELNYQNVLVLIFLSFSAKGIMLFLFKKFHAILYGELLYEIRKKLDRYYRGMSYTYFQKFNSGHFINLLSQEADQARQSFHPFSNLISFILINGTFVLFALSIDPVFTSFSFALGFAYLRANRYFLKNTEEYSHKLTAERERHQSFCHQFIHSFKYLLASSSHQTLSSNIDESSKKISYLEFRLGRVTALVASLAEPVIIFVIVCYLYYHLVISGKSLVNVIIIVYLMQRLMYGASNIQSQWQSFLARIGAFQAIQKNFSELKNHQENVGDVQLGEFKESICLKGVSHAYGKIKILRNFTLEISKNQNVAFLGPSGVGKTTLIDILCGLLTPSEGEISIDNISYKKLNKSSFRSKIGYITQVNYLYDDSVANNVSLWKYSRDGESSMAKIIEATKAANAHEFIMKLEDGYQTQIGDKGVRLSEGQKQRLAIARELYKKPQILILDEATSSLDSESEKLIQEAVEELKNKVTIIMISHRLSTVKNCDRIYVLKEGAIVEQGTYTELSEQNDSEFYKMLNLQGGKNVDKG